MADYFGNALYWLGLSVAITIFLRGAVLAMEGDLYWETAGELLLGAAISYGVGWAARYILRGPI